MATTIKASGLEVTGPVTIMACLDEEETPYVQIRCYQDQDGVVSGRHPRVNDGRTSAFRGGLNVYGKFKVLLPIPPKQETARSGSLGDLMDNLDGFLGKRRGWPGDGY